MKYQIRFIKGERAGQVFPVSADSISIGRSHSNDIMLEAPDVSRKHVIISNRDRGLFIDNLSSRATRYGSMDLKMGDSVPFAVNNEVFIGKENSFVLESCQDESSDEDKTSLPEDNTVVTGPQVLNEDTNLESVLTGQQTGTSATAASQILEEDSSQIRETESESDQTVGLKTRIATPEEIQMVKDAEKKQLRLKSILRGGIAAVILIGLGFYYYLTLYKAPEPYITWPQKNGAPLIGFAKIDDKNFPFPNDLQLAFPNMASTRLNRGPGLIEVATFAGKYMDIPCFIRLEYARLPARLKLDRLEAFERWMDEKSSGTGNWNFDAASPLRFLMQDNGIPYYSVSYTRNVKQNSFYGLARFFRYEDWQFVLTCEIPAYEKWRGNAFLHENFIQFSNDFLYAHWEGMKTADSLNKENGIYEAKILLSRQSPSVWGRVEYLLKSVLIHCDRKKDAEQYAEARKLLIGLRTSQINWFNEKKIAYQRAKKLENKDEINRISENCKAVFSSPEDLRFHIVRQDIWR